MTSGIHWNSVRSEFPSLENRTFLNTATYGQMPRRATEAALAHFRQRDQNACADFLSWFDDLDRLRVSVAHWIGADTNDIAFVTNASNALAVVMDGIDWQPGDEIVTLEHEFPNQLYAAQSLSGVR
ncbi:MAG: aminotransferase class V-fold PLP-dependent enzyme, partial [Acidobacteriaceae bacterium]|nr:aminotransferase class V-fold PLP-dependent enzyme [Acidobacteriaceae bacterium]